MIISRKTIDLNTTTAFEYLVETPLEQAKDKLGIVYGISTFFDDERQNRGCSIQITNNFNDEGISIDVLPAFYFNRRLTIIGKKVYQELPQEKFDKKIHSDVIVQDGILYKNADDVFEIIERKVFLKKSENLVVVSLNQINDWEEKTVQKIILLNGENYEDFDISFDPTQSLRLRYVISNDGKSISLAYWNGNQYKLLQMFNFVDEMKNRSAHLGVINFEGLKDAMIVTGRVNDDVTLDS